MLVNSCCLCIPLKAGSHILGIIAFIAGFIGIVEIILISARILPSDLTYLPGAICSALFLIPALAYTH